MVARATRTRARSVRVAKPPLACKTPRHHAAFIFISVICLVVVVLVHVWLRLRVVHMGYVLSTTSKLHHQLEQEHRQLQLELATMTSPNRLESMARRRLGLVPPEKGQVVILP